jgi:hypothetical protein
MAVATALQQNGTNASSSAVAATYITKLWKTNDCSISLGIAIYMRKRKFALPLCYLISHKKLIRVVDPHVIKIYRDICFQDRAFSVIAAITFLNALILPCLIC